MSCTQQESPRPPVAKVEAHRQTIHGEERVDNYFWLRDRSNPEVIAYLAAENAYTEAVMNHTEPLQEKLYQEMLSRIKETDLDVPEKIGDYYYYSRTEEGEQYAIRCRKKRTLDAGEEIVLDENALAQGEQYFRVGAYEISPDHRLLAYSTDTDGSELYTLRVKDLATGRPLADQMTNTSPSVEWANDNKTLFYVTRDETKRPYKLFRHVLGSDPAKDELVYHEEDDAYYLRLSKTKSRDYLLITLASKTTTEVRYLKADRPADPLRIIHPRGHEMEYFATHHDNRFFILTNDKAKNYRLMTAPVATPSKKNWVEVIPHREDVLIEGFDVFRDHLVVFEREKGLKSIRISDIENRDVHYVEFDEPAYTVRPNRNPEFNSDQLRFTYTSLVTPSSVFDYHMQAKTRELKKRYEVLGGYVPSQYQSERIFATAADGAQVPISLVYRKGLVKNGRHPLLLYGYGSYGFSRDPAFSSDRLSLLDRGFVYAIAHIRGGQEMGRYWYDQGKLLNKKNTFTDFIACAEQLIALNYTAPDKLVIQGGSAGGLLMGAVTNMRPDLFKAVIAQVPFVDVLNTMLDASIPLTVTEYDEWGNPNEKPFYDYIKSYSPYDNVAARDYPNILVTAGLNDPRVQYWEPAKWTAKLRALKTDNNRLLLKTELGAGHGGPSGRYEKLRETAFQHAFVLDVLERRE